MVFLAIEISNKVKVKDHCKGSQTFTSSHPSFITLIWRVQQFALKRIKEHWRLLDCFTVKGNTSGEYFFLRERICVYVLTT